MTYDRDAQENNQLDSSPETIHVHDGKIAFEYDPARHLADREKVVKARAWLLDKFPLLSCQEFRRQQSELDAKARLSISGTDNGEGETIRDIKLFESSPSFDRCLTIAKSQLESLLSIASNENEDGMLARLCMTCILHDPDWKMLEELDEHVRVRIITVAHKLVLDNSDLHAELLPLLSLSISHPRQFQESTLLQLIDCFRHLSKHSSNEIENPAQIGIERTADLLFQCLSTELDSIASGQKEHAVASLIKELAILRHPKLPPMLEALANSKDSHKIKEVAQSYLLDLTGAVLPYWETTAVDQIATTEERLHATEAASFDKNFFRALLNNWKGVDITLLESGQLDCLISHLDHEDDKAKIACALAILQRCFKSENEEISEKSGKRSPSQIESLAMNKLLEISTNGESIGCRLDASRILRNLQFH